VHHSLEALSMTVCSRPCYSSTATASVCWYHRSSNCCWINW